VEGQAFASVGGGCDVGGEFIKPCKEGVYPEDELSWGEDVALADARFLVVAFAEAMVSDDTSGAVAIDVHHDVACPLRNVEAF
jgi:hypothetical protein